jgi:hypothetical protein
MVPSTDAHRSVQRPIRQTEIVNARPALPRSRVSLGRFVPAVLAAGILVACGVAIFRREPPTRSASSIVRWVHEIALAASAPDAAPGAGRLGPWFISARRVDPVSGELLDFQLESGSVLVGARTARVQVDTWGDALSLVLADVVLTRLPDGGADGDAGAFVHHMDRYVLGPIPFGQDIAPDAIGEAE